MKKITTFIFITILLTSCTNKKEFINESKYIQENSINPIIEEDIYIDDNPIKIALYENNQKVKSYSTTLSNFKDIAVFDIYYTDIDTLEEKNNKNNYQLYYNQYKNIDNYKTGFHIEFEANEQKIEETILDVTKTHSMTPYLYIYIYDDINQTANTYYSHLEEKDVNENTIFSSIKLFLAQEGEKITSPIKLTVFTYDSEEVFDEFNKYRGNSSYTITIETK